MVLDGDRVAGQLEDLGVGEAVLFPSAFGVGMLRVVCPIPPSAKTNFIALSPSRRRSTAR